MSRVALSALACLVAMGCRSGDAPVPADFAPGPVPAEFALGERLFAGSCAKCHGPLALGTEMGPPLVHRIYEPSHHGDAAFLLAVTQGVVPHHWSFGPMPAIPEVTREDVPEIIGYVRWLQRSAGIF